MTLGAPVTPVSLDVTVTLVTQVKGLAVAPHPARQCDIPVPRPHQGLPARWVPRARGDGAQVIKSMRDHVLAVAAA